MDGKLFKVNSSLMAFRAFAGGEFFFIKADLHITGHEMVALIALTKEVDVHCVFHGFAVRKRW